MVLWYRSGECFNELTFTLVLIWFPQSMQTAMQGDYGPEGSPLRSFEEFFGHFLERMDFKTLFENPKKIYNFGEGDFWDAPKRSFKLWKREKKIKMKPNAFSLKLGVPLWSWFYQKKVTKGFLSLWFLILRTQSKTISEIWIARCRTERGPRLGLVHESARNLERKKREISVAPAKSRGTDLGLGK